MTADDGDGDLQVKFLTLFYVTFDKHTLSN